MISTPKQILEGFSAAIKLKPGLTEDQIAKFASRLPGTLPPEIGALLAYSSGFEIDLSCLIKTPSKFHSASVQFTGSGEVEFDVFPFAIDLLGDGYGNFWLVDVNPDGAWGAIIYLSHDPPVVVVQSPDLQSFLVQVLQPEERSSRISLNYVHEDAASSIWAKDSWLIPVAQARQSNDVRISNFAKNLPEKLAVVDLRRREIGSGFSWGKGSSTPSLLRDGPDLMFAVEQ